MNTLGESICHIYATSASPGSGSPATIFPSALTTATAVQAQQLLSLQTPFATYLINFTNFYNQGGGHRKEFIPK